MNTHVEKLFALTLLVCALTHNTPCVGDEVILDKNRSEDVRVGDYRCSTYRDGADENFLLSQKPGTEFTAGELWQFFDAQGVSSLDHLVICLDVERLPASQQTGLESFELLIEDPTSDQLLRQYTLGGNSLILPGDETNSNRAECRLEVALGYDFMKRYSKSSTEKLKFNFSMDGNSLSSSPIMFIEGRRRWLTVPNLILLAVFCTFWMIVFWVLRRYTLPSNSNEVPARTVMRLPSVAMSTAEPVSSV